MCAWQAAMPGRKHPSTPICAMPPAGGPAQIFTKLAHHPPTTQRSPGKARDLTQTALRGARQPPQRAAGRRRHSLWVIMRSSGLQCQHAVSLGSTSSTGCCFQRARFRTCSSMGTWVREERRAAVGHDCCQQPHSTRTHRRHPTAQARCAHPEREPRSSSVSSRCLRVRLACEQPWSQGPPEQHSCLHSVPLKTTANESRRKGCWPAGSFRMHCLRRLRRRPLLPPPVAAHLGTVPGASDGPAGACSASESTGKKL